MALGRLGHCEAPWHTAGCDDSTRPGQPCTAGKPGPCPGEGKASFRAVSHSLPSTPAASLAGSSFVHSRPSDLALDSALTYCVGPAEPGLVALPLAGQDGLTFEVCPGGEGRSPPPTLPDPCCRVAGTLLSSCCSETEWEATAFYFHFISFCFCMKMSSRACLNYRLSDPVPERDPGRVAWGPGTCVWSRHLAGDADTDCAASGASRLVPAPFPSAGAAARSTRRWGARGAFTSRSPEPSFEHAAVPHWTRGV